MTTRPTRLTSCWLLALCSIVLSVQADEKAKEPPREPLETPVQGAERAPETDAELKYWLQNMVWYHGFSMPEMTAATGLDAAALKSALKKFDITSKNGPDHSKTRGLTVIPYPGGRHPRIGFRDGAIRPQRETKFSVLLPWDPSSYVVVDQPEALWSNLGLTYLAHTHIDTVWSKDGIELEPMEWKRGKDGALDLTRELPNGISYSAKVRPRDDHVWMELTLTNGTPRTLVDLRVQNCVMLREADGFNQEANDNKRLEKPYAACRSGDRWIITAWTPCHRPWANAPCPCLHSDPKFPDCGPGETQRVVGWLSFYDGPDIDAELKRIAGKDWPNWNLK